MNKKHNKHSKHSTSKSKYTNTNPANLTPTTEAFLMGLGLGAALVELLAAGFGYF